eukprot:3298080-Pleurochrysis_carterae.AAC.2
MLSVLTFAASATCVSGCDWQRAARTALQGASCMWGNDGAAGGRVVPYCGDDSRRLTACLGR